MNDHAMLEMIIKNQEEVKSDLKIIKEEVKDVCERVVALEADNSWRNKHFAWLTNIAFVCAGIAIKFGFDYFIK